MSKRSRKKRSKKTRRVKKSKKKVRRVQKSRKKTRRNKKARKLKVVNKKLISHDSDGNTLIKVSDSWAKQALINKSKYDF